MFGFLLKSSISAEYNLAGTKMSISGTGTIDQFGVRSKGFYNKITRIVIDNGPSKIDKEAFAGCSELTYIYIPESINKIVLPPFTNCGKLTEIVVSDKSTDFYTDSQHILYTHDRNSLIRVPMVKQFTITEQVINISPFVTTGYADYFGDIVLPNSVVTIDKFSFYNTQFETLKFGSNSVITNFLGFQWIKANEFIIPNSVTKISSGAFSDSEIKNLHFESNSIIATLDYRSFYNLRSYSIVIPDSVLTLSDNAFEGSWLINITIGSGCSSISMKAFSGCSKLSLVKVVDANNFYDSSAGIVVDNDRTEIVFIPPSSESVEIPSSVTKIGEISLQSCKKLASIEMTNNQVWETKSGVLYSKDFSELVAVCGGVTSVSVDSRVKIICRYAAYYCSNLVSFTFEGDLVNYISDYAFTSSGIKEFHLPKLVTNIGESAFQRTFDMKTFEVTQDTVLEKIHYNAFSNSGLRSFFVGQKVNYIDGAAFLNSLLSELTFHTNAIIQTFGAYAFEGCKLTTLTIPSSLTSISERCFKFNKLLETVTHEKGAIYSYIDKDAFSFCENLVSVKLPDSCTDAKEKSFKDCIKLTTIDHKLTFIDNYAFSNCTSLTNFNFSSTQKVYKSDTFFNSHNLVSFAFSSPNPDFKVIIDSVFSLDELSLVLFPPGKEMAKIPPKTENFADNAFAWSSVQYVAFLSGSNLNTIGNSAFYECSHLKKVQFPPKLLNINSNSFYKCSLLKSIILPPSLIKIEENAFLGCKSLEFVTYCGTNEITGRNVFDSNIKVSVTDLYPGEFFCSNKIARRLDYDCQIKAEFIPTCKYGKFTYPFITLILSFLIVE